MAIDRVLVAGCFMATMGFLCSGCGSTGSREFAGDLSGDRAEVVMAALSQVGTPYAYGGTKPGQALDCSGLIQYAYGAAGVRIPRVSTAQRKAARPVQRGNPRPGDMVFFRIKPGLYHVGLMVDGQRFVHASTSKQQVRLSRLQLPYWQQRYLGAGTFLD